MSDREKLIELLWTHPCAGIDCATCERLVEVDCDTAALADKLLAAGVTFAKDTDDFGKWIPVTERLPARNETVLILEVRSVDTSFYNEELDGWGYGHDNPSHWTPLPPMPWEV